jgi:hypothetical protein
MVSSSRTVLCAVRKGHRWKGRSDSGYMHCRCSFSWVLRPVIDVRDKIIIRHCCLKVLISFQS